MGVGEGMEEEEEEVEVGEEGEEVTLTRMMPPQLQLEE